jgi:hypothetical protein
MRTGFLTAVAFAAIAFSGVAQAAVITENFTGLITSGTDNLGAFGAVGANLAGDTVNFSFSYNTVLLQAAASAHTDGNSEILEPSKINEYVDDAGDSAITESVTINSRTVTIANSSSANDGAVLACTEAYDCADNGPDGILSTIAQISGGAYIETYVEPTQNYSTSDNLLSQTEVNALFGGGVTTGEIIISSGYPLDALDISNASEGSATPEPTTWISLALGFGMVGLLKRRRSAR